MKILFGKPKIEIDVKTPEIKVGDFSEYIRNVGLNVIERIPIEEQFKPLIKQLIQYYYQWHSAGGHCHIALDDGNLEDGALFFCQNECEKYEDYLGFLIASTLRYFTVEEREEMYESDWWGMR